MGLPFYSFTDPITITSASAVPFLSSNRSDLANTTSMIPASGAIHFNDLCDALFQTRNTQLDLNNASLRSIVNKPSGQIAMSDLHGK